MMHLKRIAENPPLLPGRTSQEGELNPFPHPHRHPHRRPKVSWDQESGRYVSYPKALLLPPAYVVWREGNSFTLLVCPHPGGVQSSVQPGGGGSGPARAGGSGPAGGGSGPAGGGQVQPRGGGSVLSPAGGGQVQPWGGGSVQLGGGSGPAGGGGSSQDRTTEWVLSTRRAVCLLRSRRRTFLLNIIFCPFVRYWSDLNKITKEKHHGHFIWSNLLHGHKGYHKISLQA